MFKCRPGPAQQHRRAPLFQDQEATATDDFPAARLLLRELLWMRASPAHKQQGVSVVSVLLALALHNALHGMDFY